MLLCQSPEYGLTPWPRIRVQSIDSDGVCNAPKKVQSFFSDGVGNAPQKYRVLIHMEYAMPPKVQSIDFN